MTYLPGCPHCSAKRKGEASGLSKTSRGGGVTPASGPSEGPSTSPTCITGCGRPVPVHGETCAYCWPWDAA